MTSFQLPSRWTAPEGDSDTRTPFSNHPKTAYHYTEAPFSSSAATYERFSTRSAHHLKATPQLFGSQGCHTVFSYTEYHTSSTEMASNRIRRIAKELGDIQKDQSSTIEARAAGSGEDLTHLKATFPGPPDTPYAGGQYVVDIKIPIEYPFRPPVMKFETRLWHPNVSSQTGAICLDTLGSAWSPVLTIKSALLSLQSLLSTPEPKDPQDAEVATMLMNNPEQFERQAREWAQKYAGAPVSSKASGAYQSPSSKPKVAKTREQEQRELMLRYQGYNKDLIDRFVSMGFDLDRVVEAFNFVGIDRMDGQDYELEEAYMGDITARLLGEP
ncbi:hypothetical protein V495_08670 [Pseudogymnoascus sp. VKM F-4514 (FW-929)]|nr:hypothetical protein V495_08670 [Pseudogymnoascus sp. VKM F-4514 (FW-929)]KFY56555.1 hypothetical protein V497_06158 [Pseudogymnoascus sp. VKM F-4516 (FW-969)]